MKGTLRWFVLAFLILFALWYMLGGPNQKEAQTNPFIDTPNQDGIGNTYNTQTLKDRLQK